MVDCDDLISVYGYENLERWAILESLNASLEAKKARLSSALNEVVSHSGAQVCYCGKIYDSDVDIATH